MGLAVLAFEYWERSVQRKFFAMIAKTESEEAKAQLLRLAIDMTVSAEVTFCLGVLLAVLAVALWRGNPVHVLLLKLFTSQEDS